MPAKPDTQEIESVIVQCAVELDEGTNFPALNYEEGVQAALSWVMGKGSHPLEDQ